MGADAGWRCLHATMIRELVGDVVSVLPNRATQCSFSLDVWPRARSRLEVWPGGAMADIVKYHGCAIIVHSGRTMDGKVLGSYEILADAPETVAAFAERSITRLSTIVETCDVVGDPRLPDREYLVEMAKCEIDFVLETAL